MAVKDELGDLFVESRGFGAEALTEEELEKLRELSRLCKGDILKMTFGRLRPSGRVPFFPGYLSGTLHLC